MTKQVSEEPHCKNCNRTLINKTGEKYGFDIFTCNECGNKYRVKTIHEVLYAGSNKDKGSETEGDAE